MIRKRRWFAALVAVLVAAWFVRDWRSEAHHGRAKAIEPERGTAPVAGERTAEVGPAGARVAAAPATDPNHATPGSLTIRTLDAEGRPLPGVRLLVRGSGGLSLELASDASGRARVEDELSWLEIDAIHEDRLAARAAAAAPLPREVVVTLVEEAHLVGSVILSDRSLVPDGLLVVAVPEERAKHLLALAPEKLMAHPAARLGKVGRDGTFRVGPVPPGQPFRLTAGGLGYLPIEAPLAAQANVPLTVPLRPAFGVLVELARDGEPLDFELPFGEGVGRRGRLVGPEIFYALHGQLAAWLSGASELGETLMPGQHLFVAGSRAIGSS